MYSSATGMSLAKSARVSVILLSFCWHPLSITIETPTKGRWGVQQNASHRRRLDKPVERAGSEVVRDVQQLDEHADQVQRDQRHFPPERSEPNGLEPFLGGRNETRGS